MMGLILEARRSGNSFGSVAYGKAVTMIIDHDRRSSVKRARPSHHDVQVMITTIIESST